MSEPAPGPVRVRPMRPGDVPATHAVAHEALDEAGRRYGWPTHDLDEDRRAAGRRRHAHLLRTDPDGAWVAEAAGEVVGVALALVRGPLWFLSLLTVAPGLQARGTGARLLEAALCTSEGVPGGLIMSSSDPKALRRYGRAGFALLPGYDTVGPVDRALVPAVAGVRDGDWVADVERVHDLGVRLRGAPYGPDLDHLREEGARLLVADDGFAVLRPGRLDLLGAATPATAQALLWTALAEAPRDGEGEVDLPPRTAGQQWAVEVALAARLTLTPGTSLCTRGRLGPLRPYLPSGTFG